uniref:Uncharacterized protein n=1 Tax=Astatotilapia calliptera TaxID=8154 RepID=A0A3P8QZR4_ASTCA
MVRSRLTPITILSGTTDPNMEIVSQFQCPVCLDYALLPVLQCQSGHLSNFLINTCHEHICALDAVRGSLFAQRAEVTWVPTGTMKKADSVLFPCMYAASGCSVTLPQTHKTRTSCGWQGSLKGVVPHLMQQHKSITTLQVRRLYGNLPSMDSCPFHFRTLEPRPLFPRHRCVCIYISLWRTL